MSTDHLIERRQQARQSISDSIRAERNRAGMSQADLAKAISTSQTAISGWETGSSMPTIDRVWQIADLLDISIDTLVGRDVNRNVGSKEWSHFSRVSSL